jgi:hypothetical protein
MENEFQYDKLELVTDSHYPEHKYICLRGLDDSEVHVKVFTKIDDDGSKDFLDIVVYANKERVSMNLMAIKGKLQMMFESEHGETEHQPTDDFPKGIRLLNATRNAIR